MSGWQRWGGGLYLVVWGGALLCSAVKPDSLLGCFFIGPLGGFGQKLGRIIGFGFGPILVVGGLVVLIQPPGG